MLSAPRGHRSAAGVLALTSLCVAICATPRAAQTPLFAPPPAPPRAQTTAVSHPDTIHADLDAIFAAPALARALTAVRVTSLRDGRVIYERNADTMVMPASNLKIVTVAVAAARLGWDYRFQTRLEAAGSIAEGVLHGDLIVTGGGDPSIVAQDLVGSALFDRWADALHAAGIDHVDGRLIGDDRAFAREPLGAGWAWDYLSAGYAAPSGALSYNENIAIARMAAGATAGAPGRVELGPPGHSLDLVNEMTTGPAGSASSATFLRLPGSARLTVRGQVPIGGAPLTRTTAIDDPTRFFIEALRLGLSTHGIGVAGGAWNVDDLKAPPAAGMRRLIDRHESEPLSSLAGYAMKVSQNFYGETFLKAIGRAAGGIGSAETGRQAVRETLTSWGLPADALVMSDGSGLSRYDYVTAGLLTAVLMHVWQDERLRGPFLAALPVGGRDGTLESRMKTPDLDRLVQAKTGTISNVRALSGYLDTPAGEKLAFSMIANNFTAPSAQVDAVVERALARLAR
jgi:serine-type D-Ala-D-Ala carboxypeptidase/endopeptidase (penicillin-binding protein 4)